MKPQSREILWLLQFKGDLGVTQQDAIREVACYRLAARISDLRADGYNIRSLRARSPLRKGVTYTRYVLVEETEQTSMGFEPTIMGSV